MPRVRAGRVRGARPRRAALPARSVRVPAGRAWGEPAGRGCSRPPLPAHGQRPPLAPPRAHPRPPWQLHLEKVPDPQAANADAVKRELGPAPAAAAHFAVLPAAHPARRLCPSRRKGAGGTPRPRRGLPRLPRNAALAPPPRLRSAPLLRLPGSRGALFLHRRFLPEHPFFFFPFHPFGGGGGGGREEVFNEGCSAPPPAPERCCPSLSGEGGELPGRQRQVPVPCCAAGESGGGWWGECLCVRGGGGYLFIYCSWWLQLADLGRSRRHCQKDYCQGRGVGGRERRPRGSRGSGERQIFSSRLGFCRRGMRPD